MSKSLAIKLVNKVEIQLGERICVGNDAVAAAVDAQSIIILSRNMLLAVNDRRRFHAQAQ